MNPFGWIICRRRGHVWTLRDAPSTIEWLHPWFCERCGKTR